MGCSVGLLTELVAPITNFGLNLYNADTYYSKECAWYKGKGYEGFCEIAPATATTPAGT